MGFFKDRKDAVKQYANSLGKPKQVEEVKIIFGEDYIQSCMAIKEAIINKTWNGGNQLTIGFDDELLDEINYCVRSHEGSSRVLYSEEMQFIDVVGESFHQEELKELYNEVQDSWLAGFLMPEPLNPHDTNAISVMIICEPSDGGDEYKVVQAGHLKREQAKKVSKKIINFAENDAYIPILLKLSGGSLDKPNLGVIARAKTDALKF